MIANSSAAQAARNVPMSPAHETAPLAIAPSESVQASDASATATRTQHAAQPVPPAQQDAPSTPTPRPSAWREYLGLLGVLLAGVALRAWIISDGTLGHMPDLRLFAIWSEGLATRGLAAFYATADLCDYPPLSILIYYATGLAAQALGIGFEYPGPIITLLKVPACLADLAIAVLLFVAGSRRYSRRAGAAAAALFFLNPAVLYDTAYWGQVDTIYALFLLASLMLVGRGRWGWAGAALAAALLAKFQTIAVAPLIIFEVYRLGGWRALGVKLMGMITLTALILAPFSWTGTLDDVMLRSYVEVVGQYPYLSKGAYNIWHLYGNPSQSDAGHPPFLLNLIAQGRTELNADESLLLRFTWRSFSLALYALVVAVIVSLYSLRPGTPNRYLTAGLLVLAFFLFPTEMHERYTIPALVILPLWAIAARKNERVYAALSMLVLLNLAAIEPAAGGASFIAAGVLAVFALLLIVPFRGAATLAAETPPARPDTDPPPLRPTPRLIPLFRGATLLAVLGALGVTAWALTLSRPATNATPDQNLVYLSALNPLRSQQGWGNLQRDRSVSGGTLRLEQRLYLRGVGTHAPAEIVYDIPAGAAEFRVRAGVHHNPRQWGTLVLRIALDREVVYVSPKLTGAGPIVDVALPLRDAKQLTIFADHAGDGLRSDHLDLALARFVLASTPAAPPPTELAEPRPPAEPRP